MIFSLRYQFLISLFIKTYKTISLFLLVLISHQVFCQTNTVATGNWNTPGTWSTGIVPGNGTTTNVNHALTLDRNLSPTAVYTINAPVIDPVGGTNYNLDVSGTLDVNANVQAGGTLTVSDEVIIRSGDTLTIGYPGSTADNIIEAFASMTIEAGGVLIVNGNLEVQAFGQIDCDGEILIDGNFVGGSFIIFPSTVSGSGSITTTGTTTTAWPSTVFGSGTDCGTGPCSNGSTCGISNTIGSAQSICSGDTPAALTGSAPAGVTYQWQISTTSPISGYTDISGATGQDYSPGAISVATWFRRRATVTAGGCVTHSMAVKISMTNLTASVSIASTATTICTGTSVTFTATPVNGGGAPDYQWKLNGSDVGTNNTTYVTTTLANNDIVTCVMTSNSSCILGSPATSNGITMTVNSPAPAIVSISTVSSTSFCGNGGNVNFTATPTNGGGAPSYQWKRNRGGTISNVGANSPTYNHTANDWVDNDIIFCVMTSNSTCVSTNPATSNEITIHVLSGAGDWDGTSSTNWNTNNNWCSGTRPVAGTDVDIYGGTPNDPLISTNAAVCRDLTINAGVTLTVNNTLTVNRNLVINSGGAMVITGNTTTVNGSITINAGGTLTITSPGALSAKTTITNNGTISGTGSITLNGTVAQGISGSGTYGNLILNNNAGCIATSAVTIAGNLTLTLGQLTSNGNVTIDLNSGGISGTGAGTILGDITVSKTVNSSKYHYIASPFLSGITLAQWNDDQTISFGQYNNIYYYNETVPSPVDVVGWTAIGNNLAYPIESMKGYALYFSGVATVDQTGTYTHSATPSNVTLTNTVSVDLTVDGWNLVGNPYPSTIDWSAASGWTKTGIGNAIYCWDPVNDRYTTFVGGIGTNGGTRYIPSMQGFWVNVTASGSTGTLGMNNNVRVTSTNPALWKLASNKKILKLRANTGSYSDETVIRFTEDAANSFDDQLDAFKLKNEGNTPSLYTKMAQAEYSVNSLADTTTEISIPLHLKAGLAGQYTLNAEELGAFDNFYEITLEDKFLDYTQNLIEVPAYDFQVNTGDTTGRFMIHFKKSNINSVNTAQALSSINIRSFEKTIYFNFTNIQATNCDIGVYNVMGRPLSDISGADISSGSYSLDFPTENGIYLVKVVIGGEFFTQKVYLK